MGRALETLYPSGVTELYSLSAATAVQVKLRKGDRLCLAGKAVLVLR